MPVLGLIELIFIAGFFILMVIGTALDRRYNESPKWWILGLGLTIAIIYFWGKTDFSSIWTAVQSWSFWSPIATYLGAGLIYSVFEFILSVRKMARSHSASWEKFINTKETVYTYIEGEHAGDTVAPQWVFVKDGKAYVKTNRRGAIGINHEVEVPLNTTVTDFREAFKKAMAVGASEADKKKADELFHRYKHDDEYRLSDLKKDFVQVELNKETFEVQPTINRGRLSAFIGAWTFFWPAYAVSLILGDFLVEVFRVIGDFFSKLGGRFVRLTFANTFKV